jgi:hypothetical protein
MSDVTVSRIEGLGPPITGPTALGNDPRRLLRLTWALAVTDWRLRFFGSALGYLWSFVQPLMLFGVLYTVFSVLLNFSGDERFYPVALLRRAQPGQPREPRAQDRVPAPGGPDGHGAHRVL